MKRFLPLAALGIAIMFVPGPMAQSSAAPPVFGREPGLVGTWRLMRFENRDKAGTVTTPYGEHPRGYFIYDRTGHLSIHIMRNPPLPPFKSGARDTASDAEKLAASDAYLGYFGTYRVDKANHVLHHQVEGALDTTYTNTVQLRPYRLKGDTLIIELDDPEKGAHYYRELRRVR